MQKAFSILTLALCSIQAISWCSASAEPALPKPLSVADKREQSFDSGWRFLRSDVSGGEAPGFDDSKWRRLDVPHDWSIEDLPEKKQEIPELMAVGGEWRFQKGDNPDWSARELNDENWQSVKLPDNWEHHSDYTADNAYGWFRRRIAVPAGLKGKDFDLLLGRIDDADETWFNGQRIGGTGTFPPNFATAWNVDRRYRVPASLAKGDGTDVIAVRVFDGAQNGGIYAAGTRSERIGPFDPQSSENRHFTGNTLGGIGWYRKRFQINQPNKRVSVRFDGVYMNADFWLNGQLLGNHPYGYTSFEFDLTPYLKRGDNVLAVRVRNEGRNSRWYSGSGIYRHVWLTTRAPIHVPTGGLFVTTPEVSKGKALINVSSEVRNTSAVETNVTVRARVMNTAGKVIKTVEGKAHLSPHETRSLTQNVEVLSPRMWSPASPHRYIAQIEVLSSGKVLDAVTTQFGIRTIEVDATRGFRLNGQMLKLKGGCIHHDNGPLGSAAIDRAEERKVELMKANGFNAIRTSHNPPSPALLDACDRLGMLVIDEAFDQWNESKENNQQDYHLYFDNWYERDIASMVRRDRNHPCVIMWSIGNEIPEQYRAEATQKRLREAVLTHDSTRAITQAIHRGGDWERSSDAAFKYLDVGGYNYLPDKYESDHARNPNRVIMGTESYPKDTFEYWSQVEQHPYVIGDFVWTAMDYLGESGLAHSVLSNEADSFFMPWPYFNAWSGDLDICGFKKPQSYYRDVVWRRSPLEMMVHAPIPAGLSERVSGWGWPNELQSWNWRGHEGTPMQVSVYSRCERVRLELNGQVVGEQPVSDATRLTAKFDVPYAPGTLRAIGLTGGRVVAQTLLRTSGAPLRLKLTADRTRIRKSRDALSYVTVEVVDKNGQRVPDAEVTVRFSVTGVGELAAQGSAVPNQPASFRAPLRKTFQGRALAILRPHGVAGQITLRASADGLQPAIITVQAR
jgi:beta-galactosidase